MTMTVHPSRQVDREAFLDLYLARLDLDRSQMDRHGRNDPAVRERLSQAQRALEPKGRATTLVVESSDGTLAGYITVSIHEPEITSDEGMVLTGSVDEIYVRREHRQSGVVGTLMNAAEAWFRSRNVPRIKVEAFARDEETIGFYQELGYRVSDVIMTKWL